MSIVDTPTRNSTAETQSVRGTVIGMEMADWAGFTSCRVMLLIAPGIRSEFRYGRNSVGNLPEIGDQVEIEYSGDNLFEVFAIRVLDDHRVTTSERAFVYITGLSLIAGRPKAAAVFTIAEVLVGIALCVIGFMTGAIKPAAPYILGIVGLFQICLACIVWEYTKG